MGHVITNTYIGSLLLPYSIWTDTERTAMLHADQIDPIRFEVIRNALSEATEEMAIALRRSAYSTNIKTEPTFSCVLFDSRVRVVAQAFAQPVHLAPCPYLFPGWWKLTGLKISAPVTLSWP